MKQRPATLTFIDNLKNETELDDVEEIRNVMNDREDWRKKLNQVE